MNKPTNPVPAAIERATTDLLYALGENPAREGLQDTPARVARAWMELLVGKTQDPSRILGRTFAAEGYDQIVVVPGISFVSLCEHHLLPFAGTAVVGYLPGDRVVGLSKLPRLVECFARRLQLQERLTQEIAHAMEEFLHPIGVGVIITARHSCMSYRGVRQATASMTTSVMLGALRDRPEARAEFMALATKGQ